MKIRAWLFCLLFLPCMTGNALAAFQPDYETPPPLLLEAIQKAFPEGGPVSPALLDHPVDPNLHLFQAASLQVTFWGEGAALQNSFGYFLYGDLDGDGELLESEITARQVLWDNVSQIESGGSLRPGDALRLGTFPAGTRMGFFLIADGYHRPGDTYYSFDAWNPDGRRHLAMLATADRARVILGIEDLPWEHSDRDYNDLLFTVSADPPSALQEAIEAGHIPVQEAAAQPPQDGDRHDDPAAVVAEPPSTQNASAFLEGSGLGCQFGDADSVASKSYRGCLHWLGAIVLFSKFRLANRKPSAAAASRGIGAARPREQVAQSRTEIAAMRQRA